MRKETELENIELSEMDADKEPEVVKSWVTTFDRAIAALSSCECFLKIFLLKNSLENKNQNVYLPNYLSRHLMIVPHVKSLFPNSEQSTFL